MLHTHEVTGSSPVVSTTCEVYEHWLFVYLTFLSTKIASILKAKSRLLFVNGRNNAVEHAGPAAFCSSQFDRA